MFAIIRRYDGMDQNRSDELTRKVDQTLVPKLKKLSGFAGYWLIQDGNVFSSLSLFETPEQCKESTKIVASWIRDEARDVDPQRAQDHDRQGRRSQRPRSGRRVTRPQRVRRNGARLPGPRFAACSVFAKHCGPVPSALAWVQTAAKVMRRVSAARSLLPSPQVQAPTCTPAPEATTESRARATPSRRPVGRGSGQGPVADAYRLSRAH